MSDNETTPFDYGPVQTYEVIWRTGHVDQVLAHQVTWPGSGLSVLGFGPSRPQKIQFHAMIDGRWRLTLSADEDDLLTVRLITTPEQIPSDGGVS